MRGVPLCFGKVEGRGWLEAGCDVVIAGLGWFSVTGVGACRIRVVAPKGMPSPLPAALRSSRALALGVLVLQREPLMPFEAKDTMAKATGGRLIRNAKPQRTAW